MRVALPSAFLAAPVAHRAFHDARAGRPENSTPAIQAAIDAGYGIEIDLQLSADGQAMVFHDYALDRLTHAQGLVRDHTAAELAQIALRHTDTPMPTLAQVLRHVAGRVPLLIEIKDQSGTFGPTDGVLERATAQALAGYDGPAAVMSFNPAAVAHMAHFAPDVARGLVTYAFPARDFPADIGPELEQHRQNLAAIADFDAVQASFISHHWADLDRPRVHDLKEQGVPILCWTIRSPQDEATARRIADNITFEGYDAAL